MTDALSAGDPLEPQRDAVGRSTTLLVDPARDNRSLPIDCWYPAQERSGSLSHYELLPGVGFTASAFADAPPAPGAHPLVVFSHGRSGTRSSYAMLCEGLAARGYVVVAPDHPGDTLVDWLLGAAVDDATNESQRVADLRFVLDATLEGRVVPAEFDAARVALVGHSYGGFTALAGAGAEPVDARVRAVVGLQALTRTIPAQVLKSIGVPVLLLVGVHDATCPPETDADRAFAILGKRDSSDTLRVDLDRAGHQGCSDVGLYLELEPQVEGLPDLVREFLHSLDAQVTGGAGEPWRPTVGLHLQIVRAWLDDVLGRDQEAARRDLDVALKTPGVHPNPRTGVT